MADHQIEDIRRHFGERQFCSLPLTFERAVAEDGVADSRTVRLAFASDAPVDHWMGPVILTTKKKAVRADRMKAGLALLKDHDHCEQIGIVENFSFDADGIIRGDARFSKGEDGEEIYQDVLDGIKRFVSVGFMMYELHVDSDKDGVITYRCDDWEPFEVSIVAVPADITVGVGRSLEDKQVSDAQQRAISDNTENNMDENKDKLPETPVDPLAAAAQAREMIRTEIKATAEVIGDVTLAHRYFQEKVLDERSTEPTVDDFKAFARQALKVETPKPPVIDPVEQARQQGGVQLARSIPRHGVIRSFKGDHAAEKAYRFGKWILGGPLGRRSAMDWCNANGLIMTRDQSEASNEAGGYLVPEEFGNDLIDLKETYGVFRRNTKIVPMSSDVQSDPRRTGGLTAVFEGEADTGAVSTLGWDRVSLTAKKLMVLARYSSEISEDSLISMADTLANEMAYAFANKEDECGFNGDGTDTYGGIVGVREKLLGLSATRANIAGLVVGSGNLYSELALVDFEAVVAKLPEYADTPAAKWFVSRSFYYNVMVKLALASGGNAATDVEAARGKRFLGYDVEFAQVMPKVEANDQVCALLGDLAKGSRMGTRRDTTISLSEHVLHSTDQIQVRGTERFDINVHDVGNESATAASRVAGPIVGLLTAAA